MLPAWGRILRGYRPFLSIEVTKECPLRCPGCYAYEPEHLNTGFTIRQLADRKGDDLVEGVLELVDRLRPLHVSLVGGEPLVRYRELGNLIPKLGDRGIEVQVVTSAVRPIPPEWAGFQNLHLSVSIDGLPRDHDIRRAPATYDRILQNVAGHRYIVHCTITRQLLVEPGYLAEFSRFWSGQAGVSRIWFSLFTPQMGAESAERLTPADREIAVERLIAIEKRFPKVYASPRVLAGYRRPPASPDQCIFAQITTTISADLTTRITPCQFGGTPECSECGCIASAGFAALGNYKLAGIVNVRDIFSASKRLGERIGRRNGDGTGRYQPRTVTLSTDA
jgi:MoaA/NifB/PqqE/SkfB family radical SAM enzyme